MEVGSVAFNNPSSGKIDQQRKILEDLARQKKAITATPPNAPVPLPAPGPTLSPAQVAADSGLNPMTGGQRSALESANKTSFGNFITQDSSFGNIILPVIPRLQPKKDPTPL